MQDQQLILEVGMQFLLDRLKLLICIADIQNEGINFPTDYPDSSHALHCLKKEEHPYRMLSTTRAGISCSFSCFYRLLQLYFQWGTDASAFHARPLFGVSSVLAYGIASFRLISPLFSRAASLRQAEAQVPPVRPVVSRAGRTAEHMYDGR